MNVEYFLCGKGPDGMLHAFRNADGIPLRAATLYGATLLKASFPEAIVVACTDEAMIIYDGEIVEPQLPALPENLAMREGRSKPLPAIPQPKLCAGQVAEPTAIGQAV